MTTIKINNNACNYISSGWSKLKKPARTSLGFMWFLLAQGGFLRTNRLQIKEKLLQCATCNDVDIGSSF